MVGAPCASILEKIAGAGGVDPSLDADGQEESWRTATTLAATLTDDELLDDALPPERLSIGCFTVKELRSTAPVPCRTVADARVRGWSAFWKASRRMIWTTCRWAAIS